MCWLFSLEVCRVLATQPGITPAPPAMELEFLTTGPPGKSLLHIHIFFLGNFFSFLFLNYEIMIFTEDLENRGELHIAPLYIFIYIYTYVYIYI